MAANEFVAKLKAGGTENDVTDLAKSYSVFKQILAKLSPKDKVPFALNVLCILCRNLDKVPSWKLVISLKDLLILSVECLRELRAANTPDRIKTLACIIHLHRHVIKEKKSPQYLDYVFKISYIPFEVDEANLLKEHSKTYWNILADRIVFIEQLKQEKVPIIKYLPKLNEDLRKLIKIFDTTLFCSTALVFLIKKLYCLYSGCHHKYLNETFLMIFKEISSKSDLELFKKLTEDKVYSIYCNFNECLYVISELNTKLNYKDSILFDCVRSCMKVLGFKADIYHCLHTFYLNSFCNLVPEKCTEGICETIFDGLKLSCETTEKLGYEKAIRITYPYINQMLRLFIEYMVSNSKNVSWRTHFTIESQQACIRLVSFLMLKLKNTNQLLKCDNCSVKSGLHDALRLSFLTKNFVTISSSYKFDLTKILPLYIEQISQQNVILKELKQLNCYNYDKCMKKSQIDIHNTAIQLNKDSMYEFSLKIFNEYICMELYSYVNESDLRNIRRGFYNKSICELDGQLYEDALRSAYLGYILSQNEGLATDKYMSLVIDIKAKSLKTNDNILLQGKTVKDVYDEILQSKEYVKFKQVLTKLDITKYLKQEFYVYSKLWPSILPVAGVWRSFHGLVKTDEKYLYELYEIVVHTLTAVRSVHNDVFRSIVDDLLGNIVTKTVMDKFVHCILKMIKNDFNMADASEKYGWKTTESSTEQESSSRTIPQEHESMRQVIEAVEMLTEILDDLKLAPPSQLLKDSLQILQYCVPLLLTHDKLAHGMQLAHVSCEIAKIVGDWECYIRNAGILLNNATRRHNTLNHLLNVASSHASDMIGDRKHVDVALTFYCDAAMYRAQCLSVKSAAELVRYCQAKLLDTLDRYPDVNMTLSTGRLLESELRLSDVTMSSLLTTQRHYLAASNNATKYTARRTHRLLVRHRLSVLSVECVKRCAGLQLWRRARAAGGGGGMAAVSSCRVAAYCTATFRPDDAQIKIDNHLKHMLGLHPTNEAQIHQTEISTKEKEAKMTLKQEAIETMLDSSQLRRTQLSPSVPILTVPRFRIPEFMLHNVSCICYACATPSCFLLACVTSGLEASTYFRSKEFAIAANYYDGVFKMIALTERKLKNVLKIYKKLHFESYVLELYESNVGMEFNEVEMRILIEAAFFELAQNNFGKVDDFIIRLYEVKQEYKDIDPYIAHEILNLVCASAQLRQKAKTPNLGLDLGIEKELESLKLSPNSDKVLGAQKTPEGKNVKPSESTKILVKDEEIPNLKRKVIKLNLDDGSTEERSVSSTEKGQKKTNFKIPEPKVNKPVLELVTPKTVKSKPSIVVTQASQDTNTPKNVSKLNETQMFTPMNEGTPEQFFTPVTSIKTYAKKSLRHGIVKKLESEFSTPLSNTIDTVEDRVLPASRRKVRGLPAKTEPEKVLPDEAIKVANSETEVLPSGSNSKVGAKLSQAKVEVEDKENKSVLSVKDKAKVLPAKSLLKIPRPTRSKVEVGAKNVLRRATSPGKLENTTTTRNTTTKTRRLRNPINFSIDDPK